MADTFTGNYRTLIGAEPLASPGVLVAPTKSLVSAKLTIKPNIKAEAFTQEGALVASSTSITEDSTTLTIDGVADANELTPFLASAIVGDDGTNTNTNLAPVAGTPATAQVWTYDLKLGAPNTRRTFTVERSAKAAFGEKAAGFGVSSFAMKSENPGKVTMSGEMIGGQLRASSDTLTPTFAAVATDLPAIGAAAVLTPKCSNVYVSIVSRADLTTNAATTKLLRVQAMGFDMKDRSSPFYEHNCAVQGPALNGEGLNCGVNFDVGANDRTQGYIAQLRNGDPIWVRMEWFKQVIGVGPARYGLVLDFALFLNTYSEKKGLRGNLLGYNVSALLAYDNNFYGAGLPGALRAVLTNQASTVLG